MANIVNPNLPADLPTDWTTSQYVSPNGSEVSLSQQHGYNYLMEQVNAAQTAVNTLAEQAQEAVSGLESGALTATATRSGTTVAITGPEDAVTVTFLAPADWTEGDSYTYNGQTITLTDLNGNPVKNGWKQGAPVTLSISGSTAYFAAGASGDFLPLDGGTMTGPAVGAPGAIAVPQFRNVQYGTEQLVEGVSELPEGTLYITPEVDGIGSSLPSGGIPGQVLTKTADGAEWKNPTEGGFVKVHSNSEFDIYKSGNIIEIYTNTSFVIGVSVTPTKNPSVPFGGIAVIRKQFENTVPIEYRPRWGVGHFEIETILTDKNMGIKKATVTSNGAVYGTYEIYTNPDTSLSPGIDPGELISKYAIQ